VLLLGLNAVLGAESMWLTDFEKAKQQAEELKKPILADFSGSDWCGWCIKLDKEVFSTKEFQEFATNNLILFLADFPAKKPQSDKEKGQNKKLADKYRIEGYPTVLLLDKDGNVLARTGYQKGGAKAYIQHLKELIEKADKSKK
jgi:protein disulfide-isomerase